VNDGDRSASASAKYPGLGEPSPRSKPESQRALGALAANQFQM
jgi:hypothetical protein